MVSRHALVDLSHIVDHTQCRGVIAACVLNTRTLRVRGQPENEDSTAEFRRCVKDRAERSDAEVRRHRYGIRRERRGRVEPGLGVASHRGADIAAFGISQNENSVFLGLGLDLLERS